MLIVNVSIEVVIFHSEMNNTRNLQACGVVYVTDKHGQLCMSQTNTNVYLITSNPGMFTIRAYK